VLDEIRDLINTSNTYIRTKKSNDENINKLLLKSIAAYITQIMKVFGVIPGDGVIGFPISGSGASNVK
jgi:cysteinyl-tRNA synthetase